MNQLLKFRLSFLPQIRYFSGRKGFIQNILDNLKKEYESDKEIKENIIKFKKSTKELEESEEFAKIRHIYKKLEKEIPTDTGEKILASYRNIMDKVQKETDQIKRTELLRKGLESINKAAETISLNIKDSELAKQALKGAQALENEIRTDRSRVYSPPAVLKTRFELAGKIETNRVITPDDETSGVVLHKDSSWSATWNQFKDNNAYMQKLFDMKARLDESDSLPARSTRFVTDKLGSIYASFVTKNEVQKVLEEIARIDSGFSPLAFTRYCQFEVVPNVLEAMVRGDTAVLRDWCHEGVYAVLSGPLEEMRRLEQCRGESRVLDVHHVELVTGALMEQGPMLLIGFDSHQVHVVRDKLGQVVHGNPEKCVRIRNHWALCRDQTELNPWAAWRLIDVAMAPQEQWF